MPPEGTRQRWAPPTLVPVLPSATALLLLALTFAPAPDAKGPDDDRRSQAGSTSRDGNCRGPAAGAPAAAAATAAAGTDTPCYGIR